MSRYLSTWKVSATLALAVVGSFFIPAAIPVVSTLGDWQCARPVIVIRALGVVLVFVCVAGCLEAFRRGSNTDRFLACIASWFSYRLAYEVLRTFFYTIVA